MVHHAIDERIIEKIVVQEVPKIIEVPIEIIKIKEVEKIVEVIRDVEKLVYVKDYSDSFTGKRFIEIWNKLFRLHGHLEDEMLTENQFIDVICRSFNANANHMMGPFDSKAFENHHPRVFEEHHPRVFENHPPPLIDQHEPRIVEERSN